MSTTGWRRRPRPSECGLPSPRCPTVSARSSPARWRGALGRGGLCRPQPHRGQSAGAASPRAVRGPSCYRRPAGGGLMALRFFRRRAIVCQQAVELVTDYLEGAMSSRAAPLRGPPAGVPALHRISAPDSRHHRHDGSCHPPIARAQGSARVGRDLSPMDRRMKRASETRAMGPFLPPPARSRAACESAAPSDGCTTASSRRRPS